MDAVALRPGPLLLEDLLLEVDALVPLARAQAEAGEWLDVLFLSAAIVQVVDDHLHCSKSWTKRITEHLGGGSARLRPAARATQRLSDVRGALAERRPGPQALIARRDALLAVSVPVAEVVLGANAPVDLSRRVLDALDGHWSVDRAEVLTVPSCFRGFDQHPLDMASLAQAVAARHPDRERPVTVFGVRTSGAYLGPLLAAALRADGYAAEVATIRPTDHLDAGQRRAVHGLGRNGLAVVVDDPPVSGWSLGLTADLLATHGLGPERVVIAIAVPDPQGAVPPALAGRQVVVLPGASWHLRDHFEVPAVRKALEQLVGADTEIIDLEVTDWPGPAHPEVAATAHRRHGRAAFRVTVKAGDSPAHDRTLLVEGVGQGLFGHHAEAVAHRLGAWVPTSLGVVDGCHYQWLPPGTAHHPPEGAATSAALAGYVIARHEALPAAEDRTLAMEGRQSVWEVAAEIVSDALGPAAVAYRPRVIGPAVRAILAVDHPSIVDGRMDLDAFLATTGDPGAVKLAASEGAFSHRDLASYDPVFDLARSADAPAGPEVRRRWEAHAGRPVEAERWLLLRLVHAWDRRRHGADEALTRERMRRAIQDHLGEVAMADLATVAPDAPVAVLDVDGVLETFLLGTTAPGLDGITALRALVAHGYRVVLATGRSAGDVASRIRAWGLTAGAAEYGAALVDGATGEVRDRRDDRDRQLVAEVRTAIAALDGVQVDPDYRYIVRAYRRHSSGERTGLSDDDLRRVREALADPEALCVVSGDSQSDLTPAGCTKATGLAALLGDRPLAVAVGDGPADVDVLSLADAAFVPRHARALAGPGVQVTRGRYQAGLADAVGAVVGHRPGACPQCALDLTPAARFVLTALSMRCAGPAAIPRRLAEVLRTASAVARGPS